MTTLSPSDKSANVTLSNGSLTATFGTASDGAVRSTTSKTSGKWYVEFTPGGTWTGADNGFGIALAAATLSSVGLAAANAAIVFVGGNPPIYFNNAFTTDNLNGTGLGTLVGMAIDLDAKKIWFINYSTGNKWNGNVLNGNPATGTGGIDISALFPGAGAFIVICADQSGASATVNFGASAFTQPIPSGFNGWDNVFVPPGSGGGKGTGGGGKGGGGKPPKTGNTFDPYGRFNDYYAKVNVEQATLRRRRVGVAATGQTASTVSGTVTEAASAADSPSSTLTGASSIAEAASSADSPSNVVTFAGTVVEALTATDLADGSTNLDLVSASDTTNATDGPVANTVLNDAVAESNLATDSSDNTYNTSSAGSEAAIAVDSSSGALISAVAVVEALSASDLTDATDLDVVTGSETASSADSPSASAILNDSVAEAASAADAPSASNVVDASASDAASASDTTSNTLTPATFVNAEPDRTATVDVVSRLILVNVSSRFASVDVLSRTASVDVLTRAQEV